MEGRLDQQNNSMHEILASLRTSIKSGNGAVWAICKVCKKKHPRESKNGGFTSARRYEECFRDRQRDTEQQPDYVETSNPMPCVIGSDSAFNHEKSRMDIVRLVIKHGHLVSIVESEFFENFVSNLQPDFKLCSLEPVEADVLTIYKEERETQKISGIGSFTFTHIYRIIQGCEVLFRFGFHQRIIHITEDESIVAAMRCLFQFIRRRLYTNTVSIWPSRPSPTPLASGLCIKE